MSPKKADPNIRLSLIEEAARLLAEEGSEALTLRRLTKAVGVSTMAIYTHFGSMDDLHRAVRKEGFARLASRMAAVERTDDPVTDLAMLGWTYLDNALSNPNLYVAMLMEQQGAVPGEPVGLDTFAGLVNAVARCIDAERFRSDDPVKLATQLWVAGHGVATLAIAGYMSEPEAWSCLQDMGVNLMTAFADDPDSVAPSIELAVTRVVSGSDDSSRYGPTTSAVRLPDR